MAAKILSDYCGNQAIDDFPQCSHHGFTLVEALIALFIFSWLSLAAYQMLDQVILTQATNKKASDTLALNQRVNRQMAKDFRYMVDRPIIDEKGFQQPSLVLDGEESEIAFTRRGWSNPLGWRRSNLQRVEYQLDYHPEVNDDTSAFYNDERLFLIRKYWPVLDRIESTNFQRQVLMAGLSDIEFQFKSSADAEWDPFSQSSAQPYAIEVTILFDDDQISSYIYRIL
ncbi:MAG: type II secretion system protein GspJ [Cellvibrionales bacterium]|nr:type II secretion system protein GspJ [Cellvibrionales bacterium]|tara:strand:+ start:11610 stop:12290 length:681 start_codon:yes stop_codon:yes gene_type:complete